jgi:hypothetical protein
MVRVQQEQLSGGIQAVRGTKSAGELAMHCDNGDLFCLLYVQQAEQGGESQFSSGPAAHNRILATRPDLLPALYRGFPWHRRSEQPDHHPAVTPYDVPVFANVNGRVSINFTYSSIVPALHVLGRILPPEEQEALDVLRTTLVEQQLEFRAESGEASLANNFGLCHARSEFVDGGTPDRRRLVLRCAPELSPSRRRLPMHLGPQFHQSPNEAGRLGFDLIPGRAGRIARNDYEAMPDSLANILKEAQRKPKTAAS